MRDLTKEELEAWKRSDRKRKAREESPEGICSICGKRDRCKMRQQHPAFTEECGMYREEEPCQN